MAIFFKKERQLGRNNNNNNTDLKTMSPEQSQFIKRDTQLEMDFKLKAEIKLPKLLNNVMKVKMLSCI